MSYLPFSICAQQLTYNWGQPIPQAAVQDVRFLPNGNVVTLGADYLGDGHLELHCFAPDGTPPWAHTWPSVSSTPDLDVDDQGNIYIGFENTGSSFDLDPGPGITTADHGLCLAKFDGTGVYLWGIHYPWQYTCAVQITCSSAGDLFASGQFVAFNAESVDLDPGSGTHVVNVPLDQRCWFQTRYTANGALTWASEVVGASVGAPVDIAITSDANDLYIAFGAGGSMSLIHEDGSGQYIGTTSLFFLPPHLACDNMGHVAVAYEYQPFAVEIYEASGNTLNLVNAVTPTVDLGTNSHAGGIACAGPGSFISTLWYADGQTIGHLRVHQAGLSGPSVTLGDWELEGTDALAGRAGIDVKGGSLAFGSVIWQPTFDADPGVGEANVESTKGAVLQYGWCAEPSASPVDIVAPSTICSGGPFTLTASTDDPNGDFSWTLPLGWSLIAGEGTSTIEVLVTTAGSGEVSVQAANACGASTAFTETFNVQQTPQPDLGPDQVICVGEEITLDASVPGGAYAWSSGISATSQTVVVAPTETTTYTVQVTVSGCSTTADPVTITVDNCEGVSEISRPNVRLFPNPVKSNEGFTVESTPDTGTLHLRLVDLQGRVILKRDMPFATRLHVDVFGVASGTYALGIQHDGAVAWQELIIE